MWLPWSPFSVVPRQGTQALGFGLFMPIPIGKKRRRKMRARTKVVSCVVFLLGVNRFSEPFNLVFFLNTPKCALGIKWERKHVGCLEWGWKQGSSNNENDGMCFLPGLIGCSRFVCLFSLPFSFVVCVCFICPSLETKSWVLYEI